MGFNYQEEQAMVAALSLDASEQYIMDAVYQRHGWISDGWVKCWQHPVADARAGAQSMVSRGWLTYDGHYYKLSPGRPRATAQA